MRPPTEEDLTAFEKTMDASLAYLKEEGWCKEHTEGKTVFVNPKTGKECLWPEAEHLSVSQAIYRDGWFPVVVHTVHTRTKLPKDREFCYYSHEKHNRLFLFADLMRCYVHGVDPDGVVSLIAERYAEIPGLKDLNYVEGMWIKVDMWVETAEPGKRGKACYKLLEIGDWRERDKQKNNDI